MKPVKIAIIGGSGLYQMEGLTQAEGHAITTAYGDPSDVIMVGELSGVRVAFLARHGRGHRLIPSQVPYRANIHALKQMGVEQVISVSACGSLRERLHPGEIVVPHQLYDHTRLRANTFFGEGVAAHVGVANPFCPRLSSLLADAVQASGGRAHRGGNLITIEGPRFSTRAESNTYRQWGMDLINMTTCPEAFLAREAEMCYAVMNHISDYDVWNESRQSVSVEMVIEILHQNARLAQQALGRLVCELAAAGERTCGCGNALGAAIITQPQQMPADTLSKLGPLVNRYFS